MSRKREVAAVGSPGGARDDEGYADLRSYAAIGDGRTIALVARDGRIDWYPLPDLDSAPAFAALLDAEHGGFVALAPVEDFEVERAYLEGTNVLTTTYTTASGVVRVTDSINTGVAGRLPWNELARRIDGVEGSVALRAELAPGTCLGTATPWAQDTTHGTVLRIGGLIMAARTLGERAVHRADQSITVDYVTEPASRQLFAVVATEREPLYLRTPEDVDGGVDRTIENWRVWSDDVAYDGPWPDAVRRSVLALKLLVHSPTGAIAAAATTSLPESREGGKNWDYRYAWIRDAAYTLKALLRFGLREETHASASWLLRTILSHGPQPHAFYQLNGDLPVGRGRRDVPGWRGIGPVVAGNDAADRLQLGVYGDLFQTVRLAVDHGHVLDADTGRLLAGLADQACDRWRMRDAGLWELPDEQHYTSSKLGCWDALQCAAYLADLGQIPGDPSRWRSEAGRIKAWVEDNCWDERQGSYVWYPGTDKLDASILLHAIGGFDRGERMSSTIDALSEELGDGPHLYRYSGVSKEEGTFVACSFWRVSALHVVGRGAEAHELMDALVGCANDVGMYAEMIDPRTGDFLGNLPQALSHLALVNAALTLSGQDG